MTKRASQRLLKLLNEERAALLAGDLTAVSAFAAEKEALAAAFGDVSTAELRDLSAVLARNGRLLAAARDGLATVQATLKQQRAARSTLSSYDKSGNATVIAQPTRATERRF